MPRSQFLSPSHPDPASSAPEVYELSAARPPGESEGALPLARKHVVRRISEARQALYRFEAMERTNRWSGHLLTFGQYVIGGVLASSFVQQALTPAAVGFLGVLVLLASLMKQQFHPDVRASQAAQTVSKLRALIRYAEDRVAELTTTGQASSADYHALVRKVSEESIRIEAREDNEGDNDSQGARDKESP